jgi:hypothetical protein
MNKMLLGLILLAACGGGDGESIGPGSQSFDPPSEMMGSGKPSDATSVTCTNAEDCGYWHCRCEDGFVVNSALCTNGYCMNAQAACPRACQYFNHGGWTGEAGGGPQTMQPQTCGGLGSQNPACESCMKQDCCDEAASCGNSSQCFPAWDCAIACNGDTFCEADCQDAYPSGYGAFENLRECLLDNCYSECVGEL